MAQPAHEDTGTSQHTARLSSAQTQDDTTHTNRSIFLQETPRIPGEGLLENQDPGQAPLSPRVVVTEAAL